MALDPAAVGKTTEPLVHRYDWKETVLYALGVGATADELDYLFEGMGPKVLPTFAVVPTFAVPQALLGAVGGDMLGVVHGAQAIRLHKPFAPAGTLTTIGKVGGVYDLKRLATAVFTSETRDEAGELVCETEWLIIFRNDGGFGGERPPKRERVKTPEREPDFRVTEKTTREQALLYRLSGDLNPLHADPSIGQRAGFSGTILHGLCTYGYAGRAVLREVCGGDPARLVSLRGEFKSPVFPGDTLTTLGWREEGRVILECHDSETGELVFGSAYAEIA